MASPQYQDEVLVTLTSQNPPRFFAYPNRRIFLSKEKSVLVIGRTSKRKPDLEASKNNAWLDSAVMSRVHAELRLDHGNQKLYIKDVGSLHGTFLNDVLLPKNEPSLLSDGDFLKFGVPIDRGTDRFPPCVMQVRYHFGTLPSNNNTSKSFMVPDETDSDFEELSCDEDGSIHSSNSILDKSKTCVSPCQTGKSSDAESSSQYPTSNMRSGIGTDNTFQPLSPAFGSSKYKDRDIIMVPSDHEDGSDDAPSEIEIGTDPDHSHSSLDYEHSDISDEDEAMDELEPKEGHYAQVDHEYGLCPFSDAEARWTAPLAPGFPGYEAPVQDRPVSEMDRHEKDLYIDLLAPNDNAHVWAASSQPQSVQSRIEALPVHKPAHLGWPYAEFQANPTMPSPPSEQPKPAHVTPPVDSAHPKETENGGVQLKKESEPLNPQGSVIHHMNQGAFRLHLPPLEPQNPPTKSPAEQYSVCEGMLAHIEPNKEASRPDTQSIPALKRTQIGISDIVEVSPKVPLETSSVPPKRRAEEISELSPAENEAENEAPPSIPKRTRTTGPSWRSGGEPTSQSIRVRNVAVRPTKRLRRAAEVFGYAALGGVAVMSALIATAPTL